MRFALLGDHADGRAFADALHATGRHEVVAGGKDIEEVLADPQVEACIVAVPLAQRLDVARRVLQSERHAAVVHPVAVSGDAAYELHLVQGDVHRALVPLLVEAVHPAVGKLKNQLDGPPDPAKWIDAHFTAPGDALLAIDERRRHPVFPGWTLLRKLHGEIVEVSTFASGEQVRDGEPIVVSGTFVDGTLFRASYQPGGAVRKAEIRVDGSEPIVIVDGDPQSADAWKAVAAEFEAEVDFWSENPRRDPGAGGNERPGATIGWIDAVRAAELDTAASRSLAKRRSIILDFQDISEEVGFKGTMTLIGCGLVWFLLVLLVASALWPPLFWLTLPILIVFLALQLLRWALPSS